MAKKARRKDLKRPDEFVSFTMKVGQWVRDHQRAVVAGSIAVVVVVVAWALTVQLTERSAVSSSAALWEALDVFAAPIVDPEDDEQPPEGVDHFDTSVARAKASTKAFKSVVDAQSGSAAGSVATLGLASSYFVQGEYTKARGLYEGFLGDTGGLDHLKAVAVEGVAYCLEGQEHYDQALAKFRELEKLDDGAHRDLGQYHQARILEKLNKADRAAELYRGVIRRSEQATEDMVTNEFVRDRAEGRLAVIDPGSDLLKRRSKARSADMLRKMLGRKGRGGAKQGGPR